MSPATLLLDEGSSYAYITWFWSPEQGGIFHASILIFIKLLAIQKSGRHDIVYLGVVFTKQGLIMDRWPKVAIIILNWNGWQDTIECLESVYQITYPDYQVIVVDNGSGDDSVKKIKSWGRGEIKPLSKFVEYEPGGKPISYVEYTRDEAESGNGKVKEIAALPSHRKLIIIKNEKNYGYPKGCNVGMRYALKVLQPDYILLLNNDTVVGKEFLGELVKVAESDDKIGIVGPKIYYYDSEGKSNVIQQYGWKISWWRQSVYYSLAGGVEDNSDQYNQIVEVDWVSGCASLIKNETIKRLSLLSTDYFTGYDDVEYGIRASKCGIKMMCVPRAKVWHKGGTSIKRLYKIPFLDISDYFNFISKNFPKYVYIYRLILFFSLTSIKWGINYLAKYRDKERLLKYISALKKFLVKNVLKQHWKGL